MNLDNSFLFIVSKRLVASLAVIESFTSFSSDKMFHSSLSMKHIGLRLSPEGKLLGFKLSPVMIELLRFGPKNTMTGPLAIQCMIAGGHGKGIENFSIPSTLKEIFPVSNGKFHFG